MRRAVATALPLLILWFVLTEANHLLAPWRAHLFTGALYVVPVTLLLPARAALWSVLAAGLLCDATTPVPAGTHLLLFATLHATLSRLRERIPHEDAVSRTVVTLLSNLALFLVFSFVLIHESPAPAAAWPRILLDLLWSQVAVALVTPWYFALHARTAALCGLAPADPA